MFPDDPAVAASPAIQHTRRRPCVNSAVQRLLRRRRKLFGLFNHSEKSVTIHRRLQVPGDEVVRDVITDVVTRWAFIYLAVARLYTCYAQVTSFFFKVVTSVLEHGSTGCLAVSRRPFLMYSGCFKAHGR